MICEVCKKNKATAFGILQNKNVYLCGNCYSEKIINNLKNQSEKINLDKEFMCPDCGTTLFDVKKQKKVGCERCYNVFENVIKQNFVNGELKNKSKSPELFKSWQKIRDYNGLIESALKRKDYLAVVELNKEIEKIRKGNDAEL